MNKMADYNKNALITGASSGIGYEFACQLSNQGYETILVARNEEKLQKVAKELKEVYKTDPFILTADLSTDYGMNKVEEKINELKNLDILVNNAGFGIPKRFQEVPLKRLEEMIELHVMAPTRLTYAAIPKMKKGSAIINVSSIASMITNYRAALYSPTKSYLTMFSKILKKDLKEKGIKVQALCPGFTKTNFGKTKEFEGYHGKKKPSFMYSSAQEVVIKSLEDLKKDFVVCIPGFHNKILIKLMNDRFFSNLLWKYYGKNTK